MSNNPHSYEINRNSKIMYNLTSTAHPSLHPNNENASLSHSYHPPSSTLTPQRNFNWDMCEPSQDYKQDNPPLFQQNVTYSVSKAVQRTTLNDHHRHNAIPNAISCAESQPHHDPLYHKLQNQIQYLQQQLSMAVQQRNQMDEELKYTQIQAMLLANHKDTEKEEEEMFDECNSQQNKVSISYSPSKESRMQRNIYIPREVTQKLQSMTSFDFEHVKCHYDHKGKRCKCDAQKTLYSYLDIEISMQFNNAQNQIDENTKIINTGLMIKDTEKYIYMIIERESGSDNVEHELNHRYKWKISGLSYDDKDMEIQPPPIRCSAMFQDQMQHRMLIKEYLMEKTKFEQMIKKSKWCKFPIFSKKENNRRKSLLITKSEFMKDLKDENDFGELELIPLLMFRKDSYEIHHVVIVEINETSIGISFRYDSDLKKAKVTAIHIDKSLLMRQHQWIDLEHIDECKCFDHFNSTINHLSIGNPDDQQNKINILLRKNEDLKEEIARFSLSADRAKSSSVDKGLCYR